MAANPITFVEIEAWARVYRIKPAAWEVRALRSLDAELLRMTYEEQKRKAKK